MPVGTTPDARALAALYAVPVAASIGPCASGADSPFPEERRHVARAVASRRAEFVAVRARARDALAALGGPRAALVPRPDRSPAWPAGFVGSLSHSPTLCAAVVARAADAASLGLDLEPDGPLDVALVRTVCTERERRTLDGMSSAAALVLAKRLFSAKEAFYKCQYPLTGARLSCVQVSLELDPVSGEFAVAAVDLAGEAGRVAARVRGRCATLGAHVVSAALATVPPTARSTGTGSDDAERPGA